VLYYPINAFNPHSTKKVKVYFVDWVEFYLLGGILPRDHLPMWLSGVPLSADFEVVEDRLGSRYFNVRSLTNEY
jgi:hypothetical protein